MKVRDIVVALLYFPEDMDVVIRPNAGKPADEDEFFVSSVSKVSEDINNNSHQQHHVAVIEYNVL